MAERLGERILNVCCSATDAVPDDDAGVASASDSGTTSSISPANTVKAVCQPKLSSIATPNGANTNCPNDPAAVPAPSATPRHSSGINFRMRQHQVERTAGQTEADQDTRR